MKRKTKILFIYPSMMLGGSTTALLSFMNSLDPNCYSVDLQLFRNSGPLLEEIPAYVQLLPEAQLYVGTKGRLMKIWKLVVSGYFLKILWRGIKKKKIISPEILADFSAKMLSRKNEIHYDYAIGFLEGWSDRYLAWNVQADNKYAWLHSTFANITKDPTAEMSWMKCVDRIAFVTDACRDTFINTVPSMKNKAIVIENITDSDIIQSRSEAVDKKDEAYQRFLCASSFKIITVCRLQIHTKGLDRIVAAAKALKQEGKEFLWYIIGDGEDEEVLRALIYEANVEKQVILVGAKMNPYPYIKASNVMCMPSRYEGKPLAITESMILGVPPIVTKYLSANEQIQNGVDGIVVANEDGTIIDALLQCMQCPEMLQNMREHLLQHEYGNKSYIQTIESKLLS